MRLRLIVGVLFLAACNGETPAECEDLAELCHEAGEAAGEGSVAEDCHLYAEEEGRTAEECTDKRAECEEACTATDTDTDA